MRSPIVVLPNPVAVGTCCEEIHFGLRRARREGRKLLIIFPLKLLPSRVRVKDFDYRIFDLDSPYFKVQPFSPLLLPVRLVTSLYFSVLRVLYLARSLLGLPKGRFEKTLHYAGSSQAFCPRVETNERGWRRAQKDRAQDKDLGPIPVAPSLRVVNEGIASRSKLGIPADAWFVCLHIREGGYYGDHVQASVRCFDPMTYVDSIDLIVSRGGYVVRMGDSTMTAFPDRPGLIDYAHSPLRTGRMDAYLLAESRFYVGCQSGILDVAQLMHRPLLITNMYSPALGLPQAHGERGIFQDFRDFKTGQPLRPTDLLRDDHPLSPDLRLLGVECSPNGPTVLRDNVEKLLDFVNGEGGRLTNGLSNDFSSTYWEWLSRGEERDPSRLSPESTYRFAMRAP